MNILKNDIYLGKWIVKKHKYTSKSSGYYKPGKELKPESEHIRWGVSAVIDKVTWDRLQQKRENFIDHSLTDKLADIDVQIKWFEGELKRHNSAESRILECFGDENFDKNLLSKRLKKISDERLKTQAWLDERKMDRAQLKDAIDIQESLMKVGRKDKKQMARILEAINQFTPDQKKQLIEASIPNPKDKIVIFSEAK